MEEGKLVWFEKLLYLIYSIPKGIVKRVNLHYYLMILVMAIVNAVPVLKYIKSSSLVQDLTQISLVGK